MLRLRSSEVGRPYSTLKRRVEHEALVMRTVRDGGTRSPRVFGIGLTDEGAAFIVEERVAGRRLSQVDPREVSDDVVRSVFRGVRSVHSTRTAHHALTLENLLLDDDVRLVTMIGPAGSGKTLLALAAGMQKLLKEERYDKLLTARPIMPLGRDIGYLPGDKDEKLAMWMQPIFDNLTYLLSTRGSHFNEADSHSAEQRLDQLIATGRVILEPITYIRGRSIPHQFILVDEAQNLTAKQMKALITRAGPGTKLICLGNIAQIDTPYLTETTSGLTYTVNRFRSWGYSGHVTLRRGERSRLADYANEIL